MYYLNHLSSQCIQGTQNIPIYLYERLAIPLLTAATVLMTIVPFGYGYLTVQQNIVNYLPYLTVAYCLLSNLCPSLPFSSFSCNRSHILKLAIQKSFRAFCCDEKLQSAILDKRLLKQSRNKNIRISIIILAENLLKTKHYILCHSYLTLPALNILEAHTPVIPFI